MTMKNQTNALPWSVPVAVAGIPEAGLRMTIEPDPAQRRAIAALAGLLDLPALTATFDLSHGNRVMGEVRVAGTLTARVGQSCVVTLEPIESEIAELIDVVFSDVAGAGSAAAAHAADGEEIDPPEPIVNGAIDLGRLATEYLMIGIDPYPRKPGAEFVPVLTPQATEDHPFAALSALKADKGGGGPGTSGNGSSGKPTSGKK
jgi:hypothetical protein